ncbi:MAG TPA: SCO family protein [Myxococcales bacterium]|jgi:protein SCO1/2
MKTALALLLALSVALAARPVQALPMANSPPNAPVASNAPPKILESVGITERQGEHVPEDTVLTASDGRPIRLGDLLHRGKPVVLTLVYYDCPMLCGLLLGGLTDGLRQSGLKLGRDYEAVTLSFNPRETPAVAAGKQARYLQALGAPSSGPDWPFLVGAQPSIHAIADSVGFRYSWDAGSRTYAHAAAAIVLTPDGRISRYLHGVTFEPRDLRLSLVEAGGGRVGTTLQRAALICFRWNPAARRYAFFVSTWLRAGGAAVLVGLSALIATLLRRERRAAKAAG